VKHLILTTCAVVIAATYSTVTAQTEAEREARMAYMAPDTPSQKNTATCVNKMILGGRYQSSTHTGSFNGMPFEGISTLGYDNAKKHLSAHGLTIWNRYMVMQDV
jgi:hypothetical protein